MRKSGRVSIVNIHTLNLTHVQPQHCLVCSLTIPFPHPPTPPPNTLLFSKKQMTFLVAFKLHTTKKELDMYKTKKTFH